MTRVIVAFLLVPLVYPISVLVKGGDEALAGALWVGSITVPATALLGVPFFLLFRRRNWLRFWQFVVGGFVLGLAFSSLALLRGWEVVAFFAPFFSVLGSIHAGAFWLLAVWRNTDLTARSTRRADKRSLLGGHPWRRAG